MRWTEKSRPRTHVILGPKIEINPASRYLDQRTSLIGGVGTRLRVAKSSVTMARDRPWIRRREGHGQACTAGCRTPAPCNGSSQRRAQSMIGNLTPRAGTLSMCGRSVASRIIARVVLLIALNVKPLPTSRLFTATRSSPPGEPNDSAVKKD
jgi:hypothetical protein